MYHNTALICTAMVIYAKDLPLWIQIIAELGPTNTRSSSSMCTTSTTFAQKRRNIFVMFSCRVLLVVMRSSLCFLSELYPLLAAILACLSKWGDNLILSNTRSCDAHKGVVYPITPKQSCTILDCNYFTSYGRIDFIKCISSN